MVVSVVKFSGVVVLTGASGGIGRATALALAEAGFTLALVGRSLTGLHLTQEAVALAGGKSAIFCQDLTEYAALAALIEKITAQLGTITGLVNNAGVVHVAPLMETSLADWERVMAINLTAVFALTKIVIPHLRHNGGGVIVNVASIAAKQTFPDWGAYCASKFGLLALGRTLGQELRADQIRVSTVCPGAVDTALWDDLGEGFDRQRMLSPASVAQVITHVFTLPTEATLEEVVLMPVAGSL